VKISRELQSNTTIRQVSSAGIRIGEVVYDQTLVLTNETVHAGWTDKSVDALAAEDFSELMDDGPDLVLLGTGKQNRFPPRELVFSFARRGIGFEVMDTAAAARTFNVLAGEGRRVVALLYPHTDA